MTETVNSPPIERLFELNRLSDAGYETTIALGPDERAELADWAGVVGVERFEAKVSLKRLSSTRFAYAARLETDITQACIVTLEPVTSTIALDFTRNLHLVPKLKKLIDFSGELSPASGEDEVPEEIDRTRYDLAAPLLEEFSLAIDPYPRAPGVAFDAPAKEKEARENPFAVLKSLKPKG
jgi:hypothetical protein